MVSIIIPTLNAGKNLSNLLNSLFNQTIKDIEIIVIDSSSSDDTISILKNYQTKYDKLKIITISRLDFNHSLTRNYGASLTSGDIIFFMVQDCILGDKYLLEKMLFPFDNPNVGCVFCRHKPYIDSNPLVSNSVNKCFDSMCNENTEYVYQQQMGSTSKKYNPSLWFNSDVCSAVRKSIFERIKFKAIPYAEDQIFGKDIIEKGFVKVYANKTWVYHSHNYTLKQTFNRSYDEQRGLVLAFGSKVKINAFKVFYKLNGWVFLDILALYKNKEKNMMFWMIYALTYNFMKIIGIVFGQYFSITKPSIQRKLSLEKKAFDYKGNMI